MTISEKYKNFVQQLTAIYDEREASNIGDWVFESIAGINKAGRVKGMQEPLNHSTVEHLDKSLKQLLSHRPVQYVLGEVWFYKMKLKVNEHVLIPRPETEELVESVIKDSRILNSPLHILDIGTGSGCIAIALQKQLPLIHVTAIDVSEDALAVAMENAREQNVEINFLQIDFLNNGSWKQLPSFDIIISNPPYIPSSEKSQLAKNVTDHEPHLALFVDDDDPFIFIKDR